MNDVDAYIGARLRKRRLELSWSADQFAEALGCDRGDLGRMEDGSLRIGVPLLMQCCTLLDLAPGYFFEGYHQIESIDNSGTNDKVFDLVAHRKKTCKS